MASAIQVCGQELEGARCVQERGKRPDLSPGSSRDSQRLQPDRGGLREMEGVGDLALMCHLESMEVWAGTAEHRPAGQLLRGLLGWRLPPQGCEPGAPQVSPTSVVASGTEHMIQKYVWNMCLLPGCSQDPLVSMALGPGRWAGGLQEKGFGRDRRKQNISRGSRLNAFAGLLPSPHTPNAPLSHSTHCV